MAVTFSKAIATDELLTSYNNQIVEFISSLTDVTHAIITVDGNNYKIYPDNSGVFWYNFKGLFKRLINTNNFADDTAIPFIDDSGIINNDVYRSLDFVYTVYNSISNQTVTETYKILKDVKQYKDANIVINEDFERLQSDNLTYWVGYPFDISFYSNIADTVTLREVTNSNDYDVEVGVNRLAIDTGDENIDANLFTWSDYLAIEGTSTLTFNITKVDDCSGTYIKWFADSSWYYWLFNEKKKETIKAKSLGNLFNDFTNQDEAISPLISKGKTATNTKRLHATGLSNDDRLIIEKIITSPKVYLFTGTQDAAATLNDWLEVELVTTSFTPDNYGKGTFNTVIDIQTKLNTMTL